MNIAEALRYGYVELSDGDSPEIDSRVLLCYLLDCPTSYLHAWSDKVLTDEHQARWLALIQQRKQGYPVAYLMEKRGFWSLDLKVTVDTLIPRPDTELLVSLALEKLKSEMCVADLGTGSGAIALSLAAEQPAAQIIAMDFSLAALRVAKENAINLQLSNVSFWRGSWLAAIADKSFHLVVSNPPYIEASDIHLSQGDVRFEPLSALASGIDGLDDIRLIVKQAQRCLKPGGWLMVEHGYDQAVKVQQLFCDAGFSEVSSRQDFGGNDRVTIGRVAV
ncbi:MAG: peptide chain release factor N(5)-glutamine methyltransferase [Pseudomonadota bacterium]|nr:peptide chain release factor N(5)-glutamine methyltransferase [Pseudomonadota bacterium]MDO7666905.1 peptide chain release factor N(5)-glutamine methyltransferase [Pseudomonadota bacterium]MDO7710093.1 peptide chain release factor N(5)-glutamine methyltransferase [Pseudomonadota bacterium]